MPIYEYQCQSCGEVSETMQRISDPPLETCTQCGGELKKLISAPAFQFKGSGWYVTDYTDKGKAGSNGQGKDAGDSDSQDAKSASDSGGEKSTTKKASSSKPEKSSST